MNWSKMFSIVQWAKELGSNHVANLAFACLLEAATNNKHLKIFWEVSDCNNEFLDLLAVSDGLRVARIPIPLLRYPDNFKNIAIQRQRLERFNFINPKVLQVEDITGELRKLFLLILERYPNASQLAEKHLLGKECSLCAYHCNGHNAGAIYCAVHPFGYPNERCNDWELDIYNHDFESIKSIAKRRVFAKEEKTNNRRQVNLGLRQDNPFNKFSNEFECEYFPINRQNALFSLMGTKNGYAWKWFYIAAKLRTIRNGESRWLIGSYYMQGATFEVWVLNDEDEKIQPSKEYEIKYSTLWLSLALPDSYYKTIDVVYEGNYKKKIPYTRISETADIVEYLPKYKRLVVYNRLSKAYDLLIQV